MLSNDLFEMMVDFLRKILLIQRNTKKYLEVKRARIEAIQKKITILKGKIPFKRSFSIKNQGKIEDKIPKIMLEEYIHHYYIQQLKAHVQNIKLYKKEVILAENEYDEYIKENFVEVLYYGAALEQAPRYIKRPTLKLLNDANIVEMLNLATMHFNNLGKLKTRRGRMPARASTISAQVFNNFHR